MEEIAKQDSQVLFERVKSQTVFWILKAKMIRQFYIYKVYSNWGTAGYPIQSEKAKQRLANLLTSAKWLRLALTQMRSFYWIYSRKFQMVSEELVNRNRLRPETFTRHYLHYL